MPGVLTVLSRLLVGAGFVALAGVATVLTYRTVQSDVAANVYRDRLRDLAHEYEGLRDRYNEVVRRSAVTELVVHDGRLDVSIRTPEGVLRTIETPYDPSGEVYIDYAMLGGRIWIRRVFDAQTPPSRGVLIDPEFADIDWNADPTAHGKAVYRTLEEGRWIVTITSNGALSLARVDGDAPADLVSAPQVRDYEEIQSEIDAVLERIGLADVWGAFMGR